MNSVSSVSFGNGKYFRGMQGAKKELTHPEFFAKKVQTALRPNEKMGNSIKVNTMPGTEISEFIQKAQDAATKITNSTQQKSFNRLF